MIQIGQVIIPEMGVMLFASTLIGGIGWTLKKVIDIDARIRGIEERCKLHWRSKEL